MMARHMVFIILLAAVTRLAGTNIGCAEGTFRAGAYAIDTSPSSFPVIVNGMFHERSADRVHDPLHARCLVLDDGASRVAIVVVDICVMPRELLDKAKQLAHRATGIPTDQILISATHNHSSPSVMPALGSRADEGYARFLPARIAKGIQRAAGNLAPARFGWAVVEDCEHTHSRRWILRSDRAAADPFSERPQLAVMCPGYQNPNAVGPSGPVDPDLSMISIQSLEGRPIALLANYSMHYFSGGPLLSADWCGRFCDKLEKRIAADGVDPPFVAIMSQGTSGDQMWMDYSRPTRSIDVDAYSEGVVRVAYEAYQGIHYRDFGTLAMREICIELARRVPDERRMHWAKEILAKLGGRPLVSLPEIYAREQLLLAEEPTRSLKLQALRIGELGSTAIPCEVYGITGLKIKAQSPLVPTINITLANGVEGYIPPPEQHELGGYSTWEARSAGLEVQAEPKIVAAILSLLEEVSGKPRRGLTTPQSRYTEAVMASGPVAYWRLGEFGGPAAVDSTGNHHGEYERGVAFYLAGPQLPESSGEQADNRCAHFAGGRLRAEIRDLGNTYTVEMWIWNGFPADARPVAGYFFSRGARGEKHVAGDHFGIGGTHVASGRLFFFNGHLHEEILAGTSQIRLKTWNHVVLVRHGERVTVYLNGNTEPEISGGAKIGYAPGVEQLLIGGRSDNFANFEGKIDEVAVYDRALTPKEIARHYVLAQPRPKR